MKAALLSGNDIVLLESGGRFFPALEAAIATATREIRLETYIFADDITGQRIADALADAARRGVKVHVLVDGFGAREFPGGLGRRIVAAGGQVETYRPEVGRLKFRRHRLRRLHRKLALVDGRIAFVGGINIIDDEDTPGLGPRFDYAVRISGPVVEAIQLSMERLWRLVGWAKLQRRPRLPTLPRIPDHPPAGSMRAAFVIRDNLRHRHAIEDAYLEAIARARREILIASAYFLPGVRFRHALRDAARRGVAVTILLQGRVEYALLHYATQALYGELLAAGVSIREYTRGFLHAKVAVVDADWATVGSSNIDPFSLLLAREANVVVRDDGFAACLRGSLLEAGLREAQPVTQADLVRSGLAARMLRWAAYGLVRLMLGLTRYGGCDYRE